MKRSLIIIDDFLDNPYPLREAGLAQEYPEYDKKPPFPGRNSKYQQLVNGLDQQMADVVGEPLVTVAGTAHAKFRLALEGDKGTHSVHVDNCHWTMILFLSLPEHCQGGTHLYRHKETGTDAVDPANLAALGIKGQEDFEDKFMDVQTNDASKWEEIMTIPMRFNRLMIFRPQQWHDAGVSFGDCKENGRLIYLGSYNHAGY
ncbi:MAG: hypothetical protein JKY60_02000 [Kordiimonadaceae bacterium]|nr:hypothetical protein [Kordiimonadaceae bacterium]